MEVKYTFFPTEIEGGSINIDHTSELPHILKHLYNSGYYNIEVTGDRKQDYIRYLDGDFYGIAYCEGIYATTVENDLSLTAANQLLKRLTEKGDCSK